jgi:hypothetical protein
LVEEVTDQPRRGGFSIGAGYSNQRYSSCRVTVPGAAKYQRGAVTVPDHDLGDARLLRRFHHDGFRPPADRIAHEAVAIRLGAADRDVEHAGAGGSAIDAHPAGVVTLGRSRNEQIGPAKLV